MAEIARQLGVCTTAIAKAIRKKRGRIKGFNFPLRPQINNDIKRWSFCPSKRLAMGPYPAQKMFQIDGLDIFFHRCKMINKIDLLAASVNRLPLR